MNAVTKKYDEICSGIIRPYREEYKTSELGPSSFELLNKRFTREDLILTSQGKKLRCSFYCQKVSALLPCVIYLHSHTGSRMEALPIISVLLPSNINVFTFDFAGSGVSEGEFISLGWFEKEDIACIVDYLRQNNKCTCIGLWGKGMGAVAALLYADRDPCLGGMVLDSPFVSLKQLAEEELNKRANVPGFVKSAALAYTRKYILRLAKFDINDLNTLEHVINSYVPTIFCCAKNDEFISPNNTHEIYNVYPGDKKIYLLDGNHNSTRPQFFFDAAVIFFYNTLQVESVHLDAGIAENEEVKSDDSYELI